MASASKIPKKTLWLFLKVGISLLGLWMIYDRLGMLHFDLILQNSWALFLAFILVPLNWLLESLKWQRLICRVKSQPLLDSYRQIAKGISIGLLTPNRLGEVPARALEFSKNHRVTVMMLSYLGSVFQLFWIVLFGLIGLSRIKLKVLDIGIIHLAPIVFVGTIALLFLGFYFMKTKISWIQDLCDRINQAFVLISYKDCLAVTMLSLVRYFVYTIQFILLIAMFYNDLDFILVWWAITCVYLILAFSPFISFTELIVRSTISVYVLSYIIDQGEPIILLASLLLWLLNVGLLALVGNYYLWTSK